MERGEELGVEVLLSNPTDYSEGSGAAETRRLLAGRSRPDAFIFDNEILTLGGLATIAAICALDSVAPTGGAGGAVVQAPSSSAMPARKPDNVARRGLMPANVSVDECMVWPVLIVWE